MPEQTDERSQSKPTAKVEVIRPADDDSDESCRTFVIHGEDHTLGNPLRYMIMKDQRVEFCGYTVPHPSEDKINLRIQASSCSAQDALRTGLSNLHTASEIILKAFEKAHTQFVGVQPEVMDT